jgi:hypothetical protein
MTEEFEAAAERTGLGRRDFIRKGAIVGGMVWAAPAISTLGSRAFAAGTPMDGVGVSGFAFYVKNLSDAAYKFEWNGGLTGGLSQDLQPCVGGLNETYRTQWCEADQASVASVTVKTVNDEVEYTITANSGYTVEWVVVKEGDNCYFKLFGTQTVTFKRSDVLTWDISPSAAPGVATCP